MNESLRQGVFNREKSVVKTGIMHVDEKIGVQRNRICSEVGF